MLNQKKGDTVILCGFTGIKLGVFEITGATKKTLSVTKRNGDELVFDRKTGKQINVEEGKERYANSIMEDDGSYVAPSTKKVAKKGKKATKKATPVEDNGEDEEEDEEEAPTPKKTSKKGKKPAKKAPVVEDDEDDEDEDEDDDEFEEIDDED